MFYLKHTHPNMYRGILVKSLVSFIWGIALIAGDPKFIINAQRGEIGEVVPLHFWGFIFLIITAGLLFGMTGDTRRYKWSRRALIAGASIGSVFALGFWFAFFGGRIYGIGAPLFWTFYALNFMIWATEPQYNPVSAVSNNNKNGVKDVRN